MRPLYLLLCLLAFVAVSSPSFSQALPTFKDCSVASLSGSSQTLSAANPQRKYLLVCNTGSSNAGVNFSGGTAAIAGAGTMTLVPGSCKEYAYTPPANAITAIGTAAQPVACYEGR